MMTHSLNGLSLLLLLNHSFDTAKEHVFGFVQKRNAGHLTKTLRTWSECSLGEAKARCAPYSVGASEESGHEKVRQVPGRFVPNQVTQSSCRF